MSAPEEAPDRAGEYIESVLALDPARDAAEILRLRREFLGRTRAAADGPAAPRTSGPAEGADGPPAGGDRREERESRARRKAVAGGESPSILRETLLKVEAPRPRAPVAKKGGLWKLFVAVWALIVILRVIRRVMDAGQ